MCGCFGFAMNLDGITESLRLWLALFCRAQAGVAVLCADVQPGLAPQRVEGLCLELAVG